MPADSSPDAGNLHLEETARESFESLDLTNGLIALSIIPELGGKIRSLRDLRNGREWLWASDRIPLAPHEYGASYIEQADNGGWDECFPTVAPCVYPLDPRRGVTLPDHGDIWPFGWTTQITRDVRSITVTNACKAVALPFEFIRTITLEEGSARIAIHYEVHNQGEHAAAFIWSAHPLIRIEPGMRLRFPQSARFNVYSTVPPSRLPQDSGLSWPFTVKRGLGDIQLDPLPGPEAGVAFKIWSDELDEGWASLAARDGELLMQFDSKELPQVALWLNAGGWSGIGGEPYYNMALEPCIGAQDSLEEAIVKYNRYATLQAGQRRSWNLNVELRA